MLFNLLSNATKFNRDGGEISVRVKSRDDNGIAIVVNNTGYGGELDETNIALMPFGRIENPMTKKTPGTEFLLPIVQAFLSLNNGRLGIKSEINLETNITMEFLTERTLRKS